MKPKKQSFWDKPWTEFDYLESWLGFGLFVIIFSIVLGFIALH